MPKNEIDGLEKSIERDLDVKDNRLFVRALVKLGPNSDRKKRVSAIRDGTKAQRQLLLKLIRQALHGKIKLNLDFKAILKTKTFHHLMEKYFLHDENFLELLHDSDSYIKEVLYKVPSWYHLLHKIHFG